VHQLSPSRRDFLVLTAAALVNGPPAVAADPAPIDSLRNFMLMRGALDQRLVIGCLNARYYGVVEGETVPLFGVSAATFSRYRRTADGGYQGISYEVPYFTDLASGQALERWRNPYTGDEVAVPHIIMPPSLIAIAPDLSVTMPGAPPGMALRHQLLPPVILEDDIWITQESTAKINLPGLPKPIHYSEMVTLHARRAELAQSQALQVPCQVSYTQVSDWRSWMKMADHPGHIAAHGVGRIGIGLEALPEAWRMETQALRPPLMQDPGAPLAAVWPSAS
jgi:hypothetical protein